MPYSSSIHEVKRECLINNVIVAYDACSEHKEEADIFYGKNYNYIGSSHVYYINGTENKSKRLLYFYIRRQ